MIPSDPETLITPSECEVVLAPELAPLFIIDAAIVAAQRFFSIVLDPTSDTMGGTNHPPTRDLLHLLCTLRIQIRQYRLAVAFEQGLSDSMDLDQHRLPEVPVRP